jgi:hypothetical protein
MENRIRTIGLLFVFLGMLFTAFQAANASELVVASFENNGRSDLGTDIGTWNSNPLDTTQGCWMEIIPLYGLLGKGSDESRVIKISYDVAANGPAFNGVYIKLNNTDLTPYDEMSILIKGDPSKKFTTKFKIEMKNFKGERVVYVIKGINADWQRIVIPMQGLKDLGSMTDWTKMKEIVFTFDDMTCDYKEGVLYIDDITFSSKKEVSACLGR